MRFSIFSLLGFLVFSAHAASGSEDLPFARCRTQDGKTMIQVYSDASQTVFALDLNGVSQLNFDGHIVPKDATGHFPEFNEWLAAMGIDRVITEKLVIFTSEKIAKGGMYMVAKSYTGADLGIIIARSGERPELCLPIAE